MKKFLVRFRIERKTDIAIVKAESKEEAAKQIEGEIIEVREIKTTKNK